MRPDDLRERVLTARRDEGEAASAKAAAPFAAPFHHGALESSPAIEPVRRGAWCSMRAGRRRKRGSRAARGERDDARGREGDRR